MIMKYSHQDKNIILGRKGKVFERGIINKDESIERKVHKLYGEELNSGYYVDSKQHNIDPYYIKKVRSANAYQQTLYIENKLAE